MGIYAGINGVVRSVPSSDTAVSGVIRHVTRITAGVSGVVKSVLQVLDQIDRFEVELKRVSVWDISGESLIHEDPTLTLEQLNAFGTLTITDTSIRVIGGKVKGKFVDAQPLLICVFSDGHRSDLRALGNAKEFSPTDFQFPISYYISFSSNGNGRYTCDALGQQVKGGYVSGSSRGTTTVSPTDSWWNSFSIGAGRTSGSGSQTSEQSYSNITILGKSFPVKVRNSLS